MAAPTPIWAGGDTLAEQPTSPSIEYGDQVKLTQTFKAQYSVCIANLVAKGTLGSGDTDGLRVTSSKVTKDRGTAGILVIEWETVPGGTLTGTPEIPDDKFVLRFERNDRELEFHPTFSGLTKEQRAAVRAWVEAPNHLERGKNAGVIDADATTQKLRDKLNRGFNTYLFALPVVEITVYSAALPTLNGAVLLDDPPSPPVPSDTVDAFAWLRLGDTVTLGKYYWETTSTWLGAPEWDTDIYT